jgi:uncharacterized membrane protein YqjE
MEDVSGPPAPRAGAFKGFARRLLAIGENRLELLVVEVQEERERFLEMVFHALAAAALGLLCLMVCSAALVILFWKSNPVLALLTLGALYGASAGVLCQRLAALRRQQQTLSATLDQLRKDRACLEES